MSTSTEPGSRATSADFGRTTDDVKVKMPGKVIVQQLETQKNSAYSEERQCSVSISDIPSYTIGVDITTIDPGSNDRCKKTKDGSDYFDEFCTFRSQIS